MLLLDHADPQQLSDLTAELRRLAELIEEAKEAKAPKPPITAQWVQALIRTRRLRDQLLGEGLFPDPAWDMLLDLYVARLEQRRVAVSSLCLAAAVPATTALRWIRILEDRDMIVRTADAADGRRIFVEISDDTAAKMTKVLQAGHAVAGLIF